MQEDLRRHIPPKPPRISRGQADQHIDYLKKVEKSYEDLNEMLLNMQRERLKDRIDRGYPVSEEDLRMAKTTRYDLEMEIKLDKIREDPVEYYQEARKKAKADIIRAERKAILRPFKAALDWILRRR